MSNKDTLFVIDEMLSTMASWASRSRSRRSTKKDADSDNEGSKKKVRKVLRKF
jgi:hypothetical protein